MVDSSEAAMFLTLMSDKMTGLVDSVSGSINDPNNPNSINRTYMDLRTTIANLKSISGKIDNILAGSAGNVKQITNNLEKLSATLSKSENRINSILGNLDTTTANLKQVNLAGTVEKAEDAMASVEKTLNSASTTFAELEVIISNIRKGEGTLGKLVVDEKLYEQLDATLLQIEKLTEDLKLHPKRYTRILSKKEIPYQPAEEKKNEK
jgi:phospholipid/cholesterol/gamma-HCH transport system substrate-binding protein